MRLTETKYVCTGTHVTTASCEINPMIDAMNVLRLKCLLLSLCKKETRNHKSWCHENLYELNEN